MRMNTLVLLLILVTSFAQAGELDNLVRDLAGPDEEARVHARQLLPRFGPDAISLLLPLLSQENPAVHSAAYNVIEDIANQTGAVGYEADRTRVADALMRLLGSKQSPDITRKALGLLPLVVPEGEGVGPIAALLRDPDLREEARCTLQHIGSHEASVALLKAVNGADAEFACALIEAVGQIQDPAALKSLRKLAARHKDTRIRVAAVRAMAWTGNPSLARLLREVKADASPETLVDATQAQLLLAEAMAKRGGNRQAAIRLYTERLYTEVLNTTKSGPLKSAALMGLGRFGDETVVGLIAEAANDPDPRLRGTVVSALEVLQGKAAAERVCAAYGQFNPDVRLQLLGMFGRRADPAFLPVLRTEAKSSDPAFRMAALNALAASGLFDAMPILVEAAQSGSDAERAIALEGAQRIALNVGTTGDPVAAGKAYLRLYELAQFDDLRALALDGLARYPVPEAYETVMAAIEKDSLKPAAAKALPSLFAPLAAAGQDDKALKVFHAASKMNSSPETLLQMASRLQGLSTKLDTTALLGVISSWSLIGPFDWTSDADWEKPFVGEPDIHLDRSIMVGDKELRWRPYRSTDAIGTVDLAGAIGLRDRCFAYAYTEITAPETFAAQIRIGSDDGNAIWVNGEKIWENRVDRGMALDQDIAKCTLKQGENRILVKISQGGGGWCFCARITRSDGTAVPFRMVGTSRAL